MKSSAEITNINVKLITKVNAHVNTSGWSYRYLIVWTLVYSALYVRTTVKLYNAYHFKCTYSFLSLFGCINKGVLLWVLYVMFMMK